MKGQEEKRKGMIKALQTGRRKLGMDDSTFSDFLFSVVGETSLSSMPLAALGKALTRLRKLGFAPLQGAGATGADDLAQKIVALWRDMMDEGITKSPDGYRAYCLRICKDELESLTVKQCQIVIESLKRWRERARPSRAALPAAGGIDVQ